MHYFVVGSQNRDEWDLRSNFVKDIKAMLAAVVTPDTEITLLNPHSEALSRSDFSHETDKKRQLTVINWGHHANRKDSTSLVSRYLGDNSLCNDTPFKVEPLKNEIIFYAVDENQVPLASFDIEKNRLYLLWDAIHYRSHGELSMFKRIITFFADKLHDHPLFQPGPPGPEVGYNQTIVFNQSMVKPQIQKFRRDYQEKQNALDEYRSRMAKLLIEIKGLGQRISALEGTESFPAVTIQNKWVRHIQVTPNGFSIFTHPLFITYINKELFTQYTKDRSEYRKYSEHCSEISEKLGNGYGWYVGQFQITIDLMNDWAVSFINLDNSRLAFWHDRTKPSCHPHVDGKGKGCLGNLSELIADAQSNFEIESLIDVLIGYVQSSNIDDPAGYTLYNWDLVNMETMKDVLTGKKISIIPVRIDSLFTDIVDGEMPVEG